MPIKRKTTRSKSKPRKAGKAAKAAKTRRHSKRSGRGMKIPPLKWLVSSGVALALAIGVGVSFHNGGTGKSDQIRETKGAKLRGLELEFSKLQEKSLEERLDHWSARLEKNPGLLAEITRGIKAPKNGDNAPLVPSSFNCTTYVESVIALAQSAKPADFFEKLLAIRYVDGDAAFASRNHFPEADWIPNNTDAGLVKDVTRALFDGKALTVQKTINRGKWFDDLKRRGEIERSIASVDESWRKPVGVKVSYLPWREVALVEKRIPSGVVANLVRPDHARHPVLITHQGFVFQKDGKTLFRHSTPRGLIKTVALAPYLESVYLKGPKDWAIIGINLNQVKN